jgi:hypothetical protein
VPTVDEGPAPEVRLLGAGEIAARTRGDGGPIRLAITTPETVFVNCDSSQSQAGFQVALARLIDHSILLGCLLGTGNSMGSILVVGLFVAFAGAVAYLIRPRDRRRHVALNAAADAPSILHVRRRRSDRAV